MFSVRKTLEKEILWRVCVIKVEERISKDLASGHIDGASVCVLQKGQTLYKRCFGTAKDNSLYRIASMTKPITATGVLLLWERGELRLSDPVAKFLPGFPLELQIQHLLTHTSGLSQEAYVAGITDEHRQDPNLLTDYIASLPFDHAPGTYAQYNPVAAYHLLTQIIQQVSCMDFSRFAEQEILLPCAMQDTTFLPTREQWARLVPLEDTKPGCVFEGYPVSYPLGGAGLISSLADYQNFATMLLNRGSFGGKQVLKEETVLAMTTPQVPESVQPGAVRWGYSVRVIIGENRLPAGSFGWSGAYGTHFWVDPKNEIVAIYMKNSRIDGGASASTAAHFEADVYGSL